MDVHWMSVGIQQSSSFEEFGCLYDHNPKCECRYKARTTVTTTATTTGTTTTTMATMPTKITTPTTAITTTPTMTPTAPTTPRQHFFPRIDVVLFPNPLFFVSRIRTCCFSPNPLFLFFPNPESAVFRFPESSWLVPRILYLLSRIRSFFFPRIRFIFFSRIRGLLFS